MRRLRQAREQAREIASAAIALAMMAVVLTPPRPPRRRRRSLGEIERCELEYLRQTSAARLRVEIDGLPLLDIRASDLDAVGRYGGTDGELLTMTAAGAAGAVVTIRVVTDR